MDRNCKNSYTILDYITKQRKELPGNEWKILSNFNWEKRLEEFECQYNKPKSLKTKVTEIEMEFCNWLRLLILNNEQLTKHEVKKEIFKNPEISFFLCIKI
ncbi:hypothetical protein H8356DRAFT_1284101 [Neocallimastix lanati (nom. inval.)]|uniref:Uncharacterized protein n=1 Tax=Neocallimastix californiae TaxID=1754190 RepID=A0A1Y1XY68_9FUNG|nr:hypothetical protein H8356DRAFT_1284101 [Neocallimastix sp. JGI-2020a]ORX90682.1 hypothetical protein LY90DRAFT_520920 [Neocallimastix californiae]|eukprot:ORX90682.1 hypothetical protein LY90DRAFT_520920 [Neocallimastix californiae]